MTKISLIFHWVFTVPHINCRNTENMTQESPQLHKMLLSQEKDFKSLFCVCVCMSAVLGGNKEFLNPCHICLITCMCSEPKLAQAITIMWQILSSVCSWVRKGGCFLFLLIFLQNTKFDSLTIQQLTFKHSPMLLRELLLSESDGIVDKML